ncbi:actin, putative [Entamoeba invadens IP1]|uniref:Actin, putative n=1 Tax=Entamoeba invadens IP1 TaxID=370355 RepID=A0A0A1U9N1_ENTIV|nr:actin, putative [Entamoeba invadens IP1]ELP91711.1 actin, putative [Entamoeba invadens IP1]|eukprot:XP_004258482.1 actin, putative [Entamoeba invadens IP1]
MTQQIHNDPIAVFDIGSYKTKIGFANEKVPLKTYESVSGYVKVWTCMCGSGETPKDYFVGEETYKYHGQYNLRRPVERGIVDIEKYDFEGIVYNNFHNYLKVDIEKTPSLFTEAVNTTTKIKEKICQIAFETYNFPLFCLISQPVLSLLSTGKSTGFCVESGHGVTQFVPVYEGSKMQMGVSCLELAGQDVSESIEKIANEKGFTYEDIIEKVKINDIKENLCYIAQNYEEEKKKETKELEKTFKLPDEKEIKLGAERFECTEQLFSPEKHGKEMNGIALQTYDSLMQVNPDVRNELYGNIVLAGGNTMMPGFVERFKSEFTKFTPESAKISVTAPKNRDISAWMGGAMFASLTTFESACVIKENYDETGPSIINRVCP